VSAVWDKLAATGARHETLLSIFGGLWLAASCAVYARFISLPDIPFLTDQNAIFLAGGFNAIWWGFLRPKIEKHKAERLTSHSANREMTHG